MSYFLQSKYSKFSLFSLHNITIKAQSFGAIGYENLKNFICQYSQKHKFLRYNIITNTHNKTLQLSKNYFKLTGKIYNALRIYVTEKKFK